ncbi:MAG TPA: VOC family protein [Acidimicrobiia bacterium]|nr:VOC family protein [Acidimicrobiia bacterium]
MQLDHLILPVNDATETITFYTEVLGLTYDGESPPFSVVRVNDELTLQLAPWGTEGGVHLAFAMNEKDFEDAFARVRDGGIEYGDSFHAVGNMQGPGDEPGARGPGKAVYLFDPNRHLIELRHYAE